MILPPGRAKLSAKPLITGSLVRATMGMVAVSALKWRTIRAVIVNIASGLLATTSRASSA